jgi:hypothetical protein
MTVWMSSLNRPVVKSAAFILLFVLGLSCACLNGNSLLFPASVDPDAPARVVVTTDFGQELLVDETVGLEHATTAMDALKQVAEVEGAYGGGFANSIEGIKSQYTGGHTAKADWFWYVNGMQSKLGAADYTLHPGDVEHWDFRDWSFHHFVPAVVGHFPEPFVHGYNGMVAPTIVIYEGGFEEEAQTLRDKLAELGVERVSTQEASELRKEDKQGSNLILLGTHNCELVSELNSGTLYDRAGFYARFKNGKIVAYDAKGEEAGVYGVGCGLIQATQNPWNPNGIGACENVVWMVSGLDESGVKVAAGALMERYDEMQFACAAVVAEGEIIKVP